jgi:hypothetical protein
VKDQRGAGKNQVEAAMCHQRYLDASGTAAADGANADIANAVRPTQWVSMRVIAQTSSNNPTSTGRQDLGSVKRRSSSLNSDDQNHPSE